MVKLTSVSSINVFLIGNNPIELSNVYDRLNSIKDNAINTEVGFELKSVYEKIMKFKPACILIDDNVEKTYLKTLIDRLRKNKHTSDVPITILKNKNVDSRVLFAEDFLLKNNMTKEVLHTSILNAIRLQKIRKYLSGKTIKRKQRTLAF